MPRAAEIKRLHEIIARGDTLYGAQQYEQARAQYQPIADLKMNSFFKAYALYCLGRMYEGGKGVPKNLKTCSEYLLKAYDAYDFYQNDTIDLRANTLFFLGLIHEAGDQHLARNPRQG